MKVNHEKYWRLPVEAGILSALLVLALTALAITRIFFGPTARTATIYHSQPGPINHNIERP